MEKYNALVQAITTVGFPIVVCLLLMYYVKTVNEYHMKETKSFTDALNENTIVLQKLCDKLDVERED